MKVEHEKRYRECISDIKYFGHHKNYYMVAVTTGEMLTALSVVPERKREQWKKRLKEEDLPYHVSEELQAEIQSKLSHLSRLMALTSVLIFENVLFVLVTRIEVEYIRKFFLEYDADVALDFEEFDRQLIATRCRIDTAEYASAIRSIKRNARFPFDGDFLSEILS
jgi:hypothetical protein